MIKAILFDLDETLLDQQDASLAALKVFHGIHGDAFTWEVALERWNRCLRTHYDLYVRGEITFQQQRRCRIRDILDNQGIPDREADRLFSTYLSEYEGNYSLFTEVRRVLDTLVRFPMGVITNGETHQQHDKLHRMGIHKRFRAVLVSEEIGMRKPDARIFQHAARMLDVLPGECLFIGDDFEADYRGSEGAGMNPVLIERRGRIARSKVRTIATLDEIPGLIEGFSDGGMKKEVG